MQDLTIALEHRPGALADMGDALGRAAISIEGGGAFAVHGLVAVHGQGVAHFLFHDGAAARRALEAAGIRVLQQREVLTQRLRQDQPGQLGKLTRRMAEAGVNIEVLYSDHEQQLILVVDDIEKGRLVSAAWERDRVSRGEGAEMKQHTYQVRVNWTGNTGEGTKNYKSYRRDLTIESPGKPPIPGSSDPAFRGDPSRYNPEDLLVASLSSCHMLWYLHLCAVNRLTVVNYVDRASGVMQEHDDGSGEFVSVQLQPSIRILAGDDREKALALHAEAHHLCFVARSVNFPVEVVPEILDAGSSAASNG